MAGTYRSSNFDSYFLVVLNNIILFKSFLEKFIIYFPKIVTDLVINNCHRCQRIFQNMLFDVATRKSMRFRKFLKL